MKHAFARAYAKINLALDVISRREDGYHDLEMVMQSVSLFDTVSVRVGSGSGIKMISNVRHIPNDDRNIAVKACKAFFADTGISRKVNIAIEKRIPSSAGLAGGSADGAAVLLLLDRLCGTNLTKERLSEIGLSVGADIPFCLTGGTASARGRGEILSPAGAMPDCTIVIAKPRRGMSTRVVFEKIDNEIIEKRPDTEALFAALREKDIRRISDNVYNVFEPVVASEIGEISDIKKVMLGCGALCSAMTGSGSAVFGIYDDKNKAESTRRWLAEKYDSVYTAKPVGHGVEFFGNI